MQASSRWLLTLCAVPSVLLGQAPVRPLQAGDRVKITAQADTGIYVVRAVSRDTLTVQLPKSEALAYFPVATLRRVDVSRGAEARANGVARRSLKGAIGGGIVGAVLGFGVVAGESGGASDRIGYAGLWAGAFAGIGFGFGFLGGVLGSSERWESVPLPLRVSATPRGDGLLALSYSF